MEGVKMKRKITITVIVVGILGFSVLLYANDQDKEDTNDSVITMTKNEQEKQQSYYDFLEYKLQAKEEVTISVLGSSVTKGTGASVYSLSWPGRLASELRMKGLNAKIVNNGFWGYSTMDLVKEHKVQDIIAASPDLVIFETAILNDHTKSVPVAKTIRNIERIVTAIRSELPHSKIIITSPNPSSYKTSDERNAVGLSYQDYLDQTKTFIESKGWKYVDVYSGIEQKRKQEHLHLDDILTDGLHPNDKGYQLWFEVVNEFLSTKREL